MTRKKINILYLITTFEKGIGGHYFSLSTTIEALSEEVNPIVVNIGRRESPVISNLKCKKYQLKYSYNFYRIRKLVQNIAGENNISVIHCFDDRAYLFVRSKLFINYPCILTKCGGPNPKYFPRIDTLILYSKENYDFFKKNNKYKNIHLIPNRVDPFPSNQEKIELLKNIIKWKVNDIVLLRIARIDPYYKNSINQTINIAKGLKKHYPDIKLIIIGKVSNENTFQEINAQLCENMFLITENKYLTNSKELIDICNVYIGTGRGLMEAASKAKILLTPVADRNYPALVTKETFPSFFESNFSERNHYFKNDETILSEITEAIKTESSREIHSKYAKHIFDNYFNINNKTIWYTDFYKKQQTASNLDRFDRLIHWLFFHYHYITQA